MKSLSFAVLALLFAAGSSGCGNTTNAAELQAGTPGGRVMPPTQTQTPVASVAGKITVEITSATLGDDCGEGSMPAPASPSPEKAPAPNKKASGDSMEAPRESSSARAGRRACQQTSVQLSIVAPADVAPTDIRLKKVELYDDAGKLVGELTPRSPTAWGPSGRYGAWDQKALPGASYAVSYPLTQPDWSKTGSRWNRTWTIKLVVSVGGADQPLQRDVYLQAEAQLPPGAVT